MPNFASFLQQQKDMKKTHTTDWCLMAAFPLSAISGIALHAAGHRCCHEIWHNWAVTHILASLLFMLCATVHAWQHRNWYKSLVMKGIGKHSKTTAILTIIFTISVLTGMMLLWTEGPNSPEGMWHYRISLATTAVAAAHMLKRLRPLLKRRCSKDMPPSYSK